MSAYRAPAPRVETAVTTRSESHFFVERRGDRRGVFVATAREFPFGQEILVEVALHSYVLLLRGEVVWCNRGDDGDARGIGVAFHDLTGPARWVIESFCARRPAACYDLDSCASACAGRSRS